MVAAKYYFFEALEILGKYFTWSQRSLPRVLENLVTVLNCSLCYLCTEVYMLGESQYSPLKRT